MTEDQIAGIELKLGVQLPPDYRAFLTRDEGDDVLDDVTVLTGADEIVEATLEYRKGFAGLPPWPAHWVYVGDESDACPYMADCLTGKFLQTDKGNVKRPPLEEFASFADFRAEREETARRDAAIQAAMPPPTWKDNLRDKVPLIVGLLLVFVVLPAVAFGIKVLFHWLVYGTPITWE